MYACCAILYFLPLLPSLAYLQSLPSHGQVAALQEPLSESLRHSPYASSLHPLHPPHHPPHPPSTAQDLHRQDHFTPTTAGPFQKVDSATTDLKKLILKHSNNKFIPKAVPNLIMRRNQKREDKGKRGFSKKLKKIGEDGRPGTVRAQDCQNDALWLCPVEIGNPPQRVDLHFDTGSSDLWSTLLAPRVVKPHGYRHNLYNPRRSLTYRHLRTSTWRIKYGDGSTASGSVGTDTLYLGGLRIDKQAFGLARQLSPAFTTIAGDGILGLAFNRISVVKPKPLPGPLENMAAQEDITSDMELFTAYLGSWRDKDDIDHGESFYTFGYIEQSVLQRCGVREPWYVPVVPVHGLWEFASETIKINGDTIVRPKNTAIADTGSSLLLLPDDIVGKFYAQIPGAEFSKKHQGWIFPVNTPVERLPAFKIGVGSVSHTMDFEVQKEDYGFAPVGGGKQYGGIQSRGTSKFDILGDTWLKAVYAIFDGGRRRFGVVQRVEGTQNVSVPVPASVPT